MAVRAGCIAGRFVRNEVKRGGDRLRFYYHRDSQATYGLRRPHLDLDKVINLTMGVCGEQSDPFDPEAGSKLPDKILIHCEIEFTDK